nr:nuclear transport factor 2 family protein [Chloroflexota bacterium]
MDEILALEKRRIEAMTSGDTQALEEILADDLIYTHTTARLDTKASFIDAVKTGRS